VETIHFYKYHLHHPLQLEALLKAFGCWLEIGEWLRRRLVSGENAVLLGHCKMSGLLFPPVL
jgi:hypothetical protein